MGLKDIFKDNDEYGLEKTISDCLNVDSVNQIKKEQVIKWKKPLLPENTYIIALYNIASKPYALDATKDYPFRVACSTSINELTSKYTLLSVPEDKVVKVINIISSNKNINLKLLLTPPKEPKYIESTKLFIKDLYNKVKCYYESKKD